MRAELRRLHSPDTSSLPEFRPNGPFGIAVQAMVGPAGQDGEESFDFVLCTPDWLSENLSNPFTLGRHFLFVHKYNYNALLNFVAEFCYSCEGPSWASIAERVGRLGKWEFEDYRP